MDIKSEEERSRNMSKIRAKNTRPERFIRSELHKLGYRFRVNSDLVEGHPDIYFTKKRIAIFVHGCYWHRHTNCKSAYTPKSNVDFWMKKFSRNIERDKTVVGVLKDEHIRVIIIWECTVKSIMTNNSVKEESLNKIRTFINSDTPQNIEI